MKVHHRHQQPPPPCTLWFHKRADWEGFLLDTGPKMKDLAQNNDLTVEEMWNSLKIAVTETTLVGENQENHG